MSTTTIITIVSAIIIYLAAMCFHYRGKYLEMKEIARQLCDYITKLESKRE